MVTKGLYSDTEKKEVIATLKDGYYNQHYTDTEIILTVLTLHRMKNIAREDVFPMYKQIFNTTSEILQALNTALPSAEDRQFIYDFISQLDKEDFVQVLKEQYSKKQITKIHITSFLITMYKAQKITKEDFLEIIKQIIKPKDIFKAFDSMHETIDNDLYAYVTENV